MSDTRRSSSVSRTPLYRRRRRKREAPLLLARRSGAPARLARPLASGGLRRVKGAPRFWRSLAPSLAGASPVPERRVNIWLLVLAAKKIAYHFSPGSASPRLYVPALQEGVALHEIRAVEAERGIPAFVPPASDNIWGVIAFLLLLLVWHGLRYGWFVFHLPSPPFPELAAQWSPLFGLDVYKARSLHEWWRAVTALTLHADDAHLFSNLGFGLIFFIPLCRRAGLGLGIMLAVLGGIFGNAANAMTKEAHVVSIGFSTALFAGVGALCGLNASDLFRHHVRHAGQAGMDFLAAVGRKVLLPLAAGLALLGLLGGGGEARTDYAAHICGFAMGLVVTFLAQPVERRIFALPGGARKGVQAALFAGVLALFAGFWAYALF